MERDVLQIALGSSDGTTPGPAFQLRVRLYLLVLLAIAGFLHVVIVAARCLLGGHPLGDVLLEPDALRRLALVLGCGALVLLVSLRRLSRSGLLWVDVAAVVLVSSAMMLSIPLRTPELRPELGALLTVVLALVGRAALVPSSARRTVVIGLIGLAPLLLIAPLLIPVDQLVAGIPHRRLVRVTIFGYGTAALTITAVTSHLIYTLRRSVRRAMKLGPYELVRKIGEGGMGAVYEARHALLRRRTAVKLVKATHSDVASEVRFEREAQLTSELSHPNTVALYDYGRTADGILYYAMEYVDGMTLHELALREGPLGAARVLDLLRQIAASLAQAHGIGLVHRDIKPTNVMVCHREGHPDCVKVLDFGLAKRLHPPAGEGRPSLDRLVVGTPEFMAPEATYDAKSVAAATDVYAVGVLGYFLLTGSVPFGGCDVRAIASAHLLEPPLPPSLRTATEIPADLERVLMRCLAKDPAARYADGRALLRALEACQRDGSRSTEARGLDASPPSMRAFELVRRKELRESSA